MKSPVRTLSALTAIVVLAVVPGCQPDEVPATLCGQLPGAWFADATGRTGLESSVTTRADGARELPFRYDAQHPFAQSEILCKVSDGDEQIAEIRAELRWAVDVEFVKNAVEEGPSTNRFPASGGFGRVHLTGDQKNVAYAYWYCGSSSLTGSLRKFASDDKIALTRQLTERIAERVGCTQPYTRPTPSN